MVTVPTMWWLIRPIYYKCLVCCFLRRRTSSSAALMAGLGSHWARQISLARLLHSQMRNITRGRTMKNAYFIRWMNTMPCATARRLFRLCLCNDGPGIGDVIFAITARMCSSLYVVCGFRVVNLQARLAKRFCPTLTCALVGLEGSRGIASDSSGPYAGCSPS